ncbi:outer membrane beta-barrel protein [Microbulbifer bruguierae]|uniref:Outer membrane beta-barrel protein n=1 Tax=Microbulbifer bruguierae TaxID=3029061 RepID=A0ABY8N9A4_9GAMM|nr:outer membrane beta-barrel protein [Microbulbifer bruguierae]WGL15494.1 outer membrane beta-barrel protein [Microbulbifer bruguierae]
MTKKPTALPKRLLSSVILLLSSHALADREGTLTLYLNGGQYWFDDARLDGTPYVGLELEDNAGGGIGFGYNITDRWAMEGVYDYFSVNIKDTDLDVNVQNYHLDLLYQFAGRFCGNYDWQPYVVVGAGELRIDEDSFGYPDSWHQRQTMLNFGAGIKYRLGPRWQLRGDARGFQGVEEGGLDGFVSLAIGYQWGADPVVYDRDGDGVFGEIDECPQTPVGIDVDGRGCPIDSDGDGIPDYLDQCAMTPMGTPVNQDGCPLAPYDPADLSK